MSSELSDHFFYKVDARKPSPKVKPCVGGRCEKGTVKVAWLPYKIRRKYPDKYGKSEKPRIKSPGFQREELEMFRFWLLFIGRWNDISKPENTIIPEEEYVDKGIVDYPLGALYNPEDDKIEQVTFESGERYD
jgi:hypothetical protein